MKRTLAARFSSPPFFRRGNVFHLFPPRPAGRVRVPPRRYARVRAHARTHARTRFTRARSLGRGRALSRTCVCALTTRRFRCMPEREVKGTPRANRFPSFSRPPKGGSELHQRDDSRRLTMDRVLTARLSVKREDSPRNGTSESQVRECEYPIERPLRNLLSHSRISIGPLSIISKSDKREMYKISRCMRHVRSRREKWEKSVKREDLPIHEFFP